MNEVAQLPTAKPQAFSLTPTNLQEAMELAKLMADSEMVPKDFRGKPGNVLVAVQMGAEIGLPPTQAIQNIAVINGRPSLWGDAALAVVQAHPRFESIEETFDEQSMIATCIVTRKGEKPHTVRFGRKQAEQAGLWGKQGPWQQYPQRMMQMRARAFALRDKFADALKGINIAEEVQDIPPREMGMAERVCEPDMLPLYPADKFEANLPKWLKAIEAGKSPEQIIATVESAYTLSDGQKAIINGGTE